MSRFESTKHAAEAAWSVFWKMYTWCREVQVAPGAKMISTTVQHTVEFEV